MLLVMRATTEGGSHGNKPVSPITVPSFGVRETQESGRNPDWSFVKQLACFGGRTSRALRQGIGGRLPARDRGVV
jgi:hypothetical protein